MNRVGREGRQLLRHALQGDQQLAGALQLKVASAVLTSLEPQRTPGFVPGERNGLNRGRERG